MLSEADAQNALLSLFPNAKITSGQRSRLHNALIGGVPDSMHVPGEATDFQGVPFSAVKAAFAAHGIPATELIDEGNHIHWGWGPKPQKANPQVTQPSQMSDADLLAALTGSGAKRVQGSAPKTTGNPAAQMSDAQLIAALTQGAKPQATAQAAKKLPPVPDGTPFLQKLGAGAVQGVNDVVSSVDPIAQWADQHIGKVTLGGLLPTADQAHANHLLSRNTYDQQYGDSATATGGRILGNIAGSLPVFASGEELLAPAIKGAQALPGLAGATARFVTGASEGNKLLKLASRGTAGAGQGAGAQALISSASDQPMSDQLQQGAEFGGALGAFAPEVFSAGRGLRRFFRGDAMNPLRADLASKAVNQFGIPVRGSQISQSPFMNYLDSSISKLPFSGMEASNEAQRTAFSKAVAGTFGEKADNLTPAVMSAARSRIGNVFNTVGAKTTIKNAGDIIGRFADIESEAAQALPSNELTPIQKQMNAVIEKIDPKTDSISGDVYQALTRKGAPLDRALSSSNPNIRFYAGQVREALDDALESSADPKDLAALRKARIQWKNLKTVQDLAAKAGIEGEISPALLLGAVKKSYKDMAYSGAGDIGDLANIGQEFIKPPPSSGTAERLLMYRLLEGTGAGLTGAAAMHNPDVAIPAASGALGLLGAGRLVGGALDSDLYRNAMIKAAQKKKTGNALLSSAALRDLLDRAKAFGVPVGVDVKNRLLPAAANP